MVSALYVIQLLSCAAVICLIFHAFVNNTVILRRGTEHYPIKSALLWSICPAVCRNLAQRKRNFIDEFIIRIINLSAYFGYFSAYGIFKGIFYRIANTVPAEFFIALHIEHKVIHAQRIIVKLTGRTERIRCTKSHGNLCRSVGIAFGIYIKLFVFPDVRCDILEICKIRPFIFTVFIIIQQYNSRYVSVVILRAFKLKGY